MECFKKHGFENEGFLKGGVEPDGGFFYCRGGFLSVKFSHFKIRP
jgi:hypothetical protein